MDSSSLHDVRTLWADLFETHAPALQHSLKVHFPGVDPEFLADAVVDATRSLAEDYSRYDPGRGDLLSFLFGMARRELARLLRRDKRRQQREQKKAENSVTDSASAGRSIPDELADREQLDQLYRELASTEDERRALTLYLQEEDDPERWAAVLGLKGASEGAKRAGMERARARWRQRLCRYRKLRRRKDGS